MDGALDDNGGLVLDTAVFGDHYIMGFTSLVHHCILPPVSSILRDGYLEEWSGSKDMGCPPLNARQIFFFHLI